MKVILKLAWSDLVQEREWRFQDWTLPIPHKGDWIMVWAHYLGDRKGLSLHINSRKMVLCQVQVERVLFDPSPISSVHINVATPFPVMKE